jgi:hypothetical protein
MTAKCDCSCVRAPPMLQQQKLFGTFQQSSIDVCLLAQLERRQSQLAVQLRHRLNDMGTAFPASSGLHDTLLQMSIKQGTGDGAPCE